MAEPRSRSRRRHQGAAPLPRPVRAGLGAGALGLAALLGVVAFEGPSVAAAAAEKSSDGDAVEGSCDASASPGSCADGKEPAATPSLEELSSFFGPALERSCEWLDAAAAALKKEKLPAEAEAALKTAISLAKAPADIGTVMKAWKALEEAAKASSADAASAAALAELRAMYAWRHADIVQRVVSNGDLSALLEEVKKVPGAGLAAAMLTLSLKGSAIDEATKLLKAAVKARPSDVGARLRLAIVLHNMNDYGESVKTLLPVTSVKPDALALATLAYIAGGSPKEEVPQEPAEAGIKALDLAITFEGTHGGAIAAIYQACFKQSRMSAATCSAFYELTRDVLFSPSNCESRLHLAVMLKKASPFLEKKGPSVLQESRRQLRQLAFDCPDIAGKLSGFGLHWQQQFEQDLSSVADLRGGLADAIWAGLRSSMSHGQEPSSSHSLIEVYDTAKAAERTSDFRDVPSEGKRPKECGKALPRPLPLARQPKADPLGCPEVKIEDFEAECVKKRRPCVLRGVAKDFVKDKTDTLLERFVGVAPNASVGVSFPFPASSKDGMKTLNKLQRMSDILARDDYRGSAERTASDVDGENWGLIRPTRRTMRLRDAVEWAKSHPEDMYMNQQMIMDFGSPGLDLLQTPQWVKRSNLKLSSALLWLASGPVVTGLHFDMPDNLVVQLSGTKEVLMSRPSEIEKLHYSQMTDFTISNRLLPDGSLARGDLFNFSSGKGSHSAVDVANLNTAKDFPLYAEARGTSAEIARGDVLFIPAYWHHAVATLPDEQCMGLSLNLWHSHPDWPPSLEKALELWKDL